MRVNKRKIYITSLVIFHLLVFLVPLTIKSTHRHITQLQSFTKSGSQYSKAEKPCFICQFEFVSSIVKGITRHCVSQPVTPVKNSELVAQVYNIPFTYFSLRAPPVL